jgi:hypothetical protein
MLGLSDSVLAEAVNVDSSVTIGALEALLAKNRIAYLAQRTDNAVTKSVGAAE